MAEKLFSYGTLQFENVQLENFGRKLKTTDDALQGYEVRDCLIRDPQVVKTSEEAIHPIACYTANLENEIAGVVVEITEEELLQADNYEVEDYRRVRRILKSGEAAWIYVQSALNIETSSLQQGPVRLELFDDKHIPLLCEKAKDERIWQYHRNNFAMGNNFEIEALAKAKQAIVNKKRCMFVIYYQDEIIGSSSYYDINLDHLRMSIGYSWLHPDCWGKGINSVVKNLMLAYAFEELKFKRVSFCIDSENIRSRKAVEKLGAVFEGILKKQQIRPDGSSRDSAIYAVTDDLWLTIKAGAV